MSYRLVKTELGYDILEKETDLIIELKRNEKDAKDLCRKLNLGSGFSGWTPSFFAEKVL